jgi:hypothetical protein
MCMFHTNLPMRRGGCRGGSRTSTKACIDRYEVMCSPHALVCHNLAVGKCDLRLNNLGSNCRHVLFTGLRKWRRGGRPASPSWLAGGSGNVPTPASPLASALQIAGHYSFTGSFPSGLGCCPIRFACLVQHVKILKPSHHQQLHTDKYAHSSTCFTCTAHSSSQSYCSVYTHPSL